MNTIMMHNTTLDNAMAVVDSSGDVTVLGGASSLFSGRRQEHEDFQSMK